MAPDEFQSAGFSIFGNRWKTAMSRALDVDVVTVWRYATGQKVIPRAVELAVRYLLLTKSGK